MDQRPAGGLQPELHVAGYRVTAVPSADYSQASVTADVALCNTGRLTARNMKVALTLDGTTIEPLMSLSISFLLIAGTTSGS